MSRVSSAISARLLPIAALLAALSWWVFNWPALVSLHKRWWTFGETYEIGYPLVVIGIYWIVTQRQRLRAAAINPSWLGCALFVLALLVSCAARLSQLLVVQQLMVPVSLWFGLLAVLGWRLAVPLLLPCALLVCGVPVWDFLVDPLRILTVFASQHLLRLIRIPALVEDFHIVLPSGVMLVEDACSGLNLLLAALVLSSLQAALSLRSYWRRVLLVAIGVAIGIVDNWIRVFVLIAIAHYSDMQSSLVHDHVGFGWWLFVASLVPFFFIARFIERGDKSAANLRVADSPIASSSAAPGAAVFAALFVAFVAVGLAVGAGRLEHGAESAVLDFAAPPNALPTTTGWRPQYSGYDLAQTWRLASAKRVYDLTVLLYRTQQHGKKLIYYANHIADPADVRYSARLTLASGQMVNATAIGGSEPRVVWWYYRIDDTATASTGYAKWLQLRATLKGDSSAALVALSTPCRAADCDADIKDADNDLLVGLDATLQARKVAP